MMIQQMASSHGDAASGLLPRSNARCSILGSVLALCFGVSAVPAMGQQDIGHPERGSVMIGAFVAGPDTTARIDSTTRRGTRIGLEHELGLDGTKTVARIDGYYWFSRKHRLDYSFFRFSRSASRVIGRTIVVGDRTFDLRRTIDSSSEVGVFKIGYTFAPIVRKRGDFGVTMGIYTANIDLAILDRLSGVGESRDLTAPLPVVGFRGQYNPSDRISLRGSIELFRLDTGEADGRLSDTTIGADYSFNDRIALGLAYNHVSVNVDAQDTGHFIGQIDWGYDGFMLYLKTNFGRTRGAL